MRPAAETPLLKPTFPPTCDDCGKFLQAKDETADPYDPFSRYNSHGGYRVAFVDQDGVEQPDTVCYFCADCRSGSLLKRL